MDQRTVSSMIYTPDAAVKRIESNGLFSTMLSRTPFRDLMVLPPTSLRISCKDLGAVIQ